MRFLNTFLVSVALGCLSVSGLNAQIDYTTTTLSFDNITATNVNQSVNEQTDNEKEVEFGDYDNDGDPDVVIAVALSDFGQRRNKLYRNDNGVLNEVSGAPVIPGFSNTDTSRSAFFRDYDNDGFLDIVIINDSNSGAGNNDSPGKTKYYRNVNGASFVNESQRLANQTGAACNGCSADFDGNGFDDVMMANYPNTTQDSLGFNNINGAGAGQFTNVTGTHMPTEGGVDIPNRYAVHAEAADMNGDGLIDLLVTSRTNEQAYIHYNNNEGAGSGPGDFKYAGTGARTTVSENNGGVSENAMIPGDFNNDGRMDMYFANSGLPGGAPSINDAIYVNTGNDAFNRANFSIQPIHSDLDDETYKVTTNDLDGDGKTDLIVMAVNRRPYIFRNTSIVGGEVSFVEWTPSIFNATTHDGWQANSADVTGNGRPDIFVGAFNDDFLFENVDSEIFEFDSLGGGVLPGFHNASPIAVSGSIGGGETRTLFALGGAGGVPPGAKVSILLRSEADLDLNVEINGIPVASSTRKGENLDEAMQFTVPAIGTLEIEITNQSAGGVLLGDVNGDGVVNLLDVTPFVQLVSSMGFLAEADINGDGVVNLLDVQPFVELITNGGGEPTESDFVIEFLSRT